MTTVPADAPGAVPAPPDRISRRHLDALCRMRRSIPEPVEPDLLSDLEATGALVEGTCHPALADAVAVLNAVSSKLHVRRWYRGERSHLSGFLGPAGLTLLLGPLEADAPVKVVHRPRVTSTPRLVASYVGLGPTRHVDVRLPRTARPWTEVLAVTGDERPGWLDAIVGSDVDPVVWDMAWQATPDVSAANVLSVIGLGGEALAEVKAVDRTDPAAGYRMIPRPPGAIWWAICRIVRGSGDDPPPGPALGLAGDPSPQVGIDDDSDSDDPETPPPRSPWPAPP